MAHHAQMCPPSLLLIFCVSGQSGGMTHFRLQTGTCAHPHHGLQHMSKQADIRLQQHMLIEGHQACHQDLKLGISSPGTLLLQGLQPEKGASGTPLLQGLQQERTDVIILLPQGQQEETAEAVISLVGTGGAPAAPVQRRITPKGASPAASVGLSRSLVQWLGILLLQLLLVICGTDVGYSKTDRNVCRHALT